MLGWEMTHAEMVICPLGQVSPALNRVITELSQNCELVNNSFCHFLSSFAAYSAWNKSVLQICNIPGRELIYGSCPILSCRIGSSFSSHLLFSLHVICLRCKKEYGTIGPYSFWYTRCFWLWRQIIWDFTVVHSSISCFSLML